MAEKTVKGNKTAMAMALWIAVSFTVGFAAYAFTASATAQSFLANAIGQATDYRSLDVGSWFRYDPAYKTGTASDIYIITNVTKVTVASDPVGGDLCVESKFGDRKWYTWDIKVYWMDGFEADELYSYLDGGSGIPLWDGAARFLYKAYKDRSLYTAVDFVNKEIWQPVLKPMLPRSEGYLYGKSPSETFWHYEYMRGNATKLGWSMYVSYEVDTNILLKLEYYTTTTGVKTFKLSGWSQKLSADFVPIKPTVDYELIPETWFSYEYILRLTSPQGGSLAMVSVNSNDTSKFKNINGRFAANGGIAIDINGTNLELYVSVQSYITPDIRSVWVNKTYYITQSAKAGTKTPGTIITSAVQINNSTIRIEWNDVKNASQYLVYIDDEIGGQTQDVFFDFHPSENRNYSIYVVCMSVIDKLPSDKSNTVNVTFQDGKPFKGIYYIEEVISPDVQNALIAALIISVAAGVVFAFIGFRWFVKKGKITMPKIGRNT